MDTDGWCLGDLEQDVHYSAHRSPSIHTFGQVLGKLRPVWRPQKQPCQRPLRQLGFGRVKHQSEMLHGHGPLGGRDPDDGGDHRIHDIVDVTEKLDEVMEELLWRLGQHWAAAAAVGARTLLLLELLSLCLLLVWPQGVCRRLPARVCCALAVISSPGRAMEAPVQRPFWRPDRIPGPTDLELWAAGQRTLREQLADAAAAHALQRPLEHNRGEARVPTFEVPAELPLPGDALLDIAAVHVTMWVTTPYYEAEVVDAEMSFPTTVERLTEALQTSCGVMPEYASECVPTTPQLGANSASFVAYPPWLLETNKIAVVVDSTAIEGSVFGAYFENPVTREAILMNMVEGWPAGLQVFTPGSERPMRSGRTYEIVNGGVIKIMRDGVLPRWQDDLTLEPTGGLALAPRWAPHRDDQVLEEIYSDDERPLEVSAEEALHIEHGEAWVSVPNERITHLSHRGRRVWGQVAVFDGIDQYERTEPVIFTDLRGLALFPQWTQNHGTVFKLYPGHARTPRLDVACPRWPTPG